MRNLFHDSNDQFLNAIPGLSDLFEISEMGNHIRNAENMYVQPLIGTAQYEDLIEKIYNSSLSEIEQELVTRLQAPVAHLAVLMRIPEANVSFTGNGILVKKTDDAVPASQFRIEELMKSHRKQGYQLFDEAIQFLEDNTAVFTLYAAAPQRTKRTKGIIISPAQFEEAYGFRIPHVVFYQLQRWIRRTEQNVLVQHIGQAFYTDLIAQSRLQAVGGEIDEDYETVLRLAQEAIANMAMVDAIPQLMVKIDEDGISILDNTYNSHSKSSRRTAPDTSVSDLINHAKLEGEARMADLIATLNTEASADKFTSFFESSFYEVPSDDDDDDDWRDDIDDGVYCGL